MGYTEAQTRSFYARLPAVVRKRVTAARRLLLEAHPQVTEEWKQRAIFFELHSALAILLMAHSPPRLMFLKGYLLEANSELLHNDGTKYSRYLPLSSDELMEKESFYMLIQAAVELNMQLNAEGGRILRTSQ